MHLFRCAEDCIYRTGLDTQSAANASQFIDNRHCFGFFFAVFGVERHGIHSEQIRQCFDAGFPAWRTLVDVSLAFGDGFGVGPAAGVVALAALGLGQDGFDPVCYRIGFDLKSSCRPAQPETEQAAE